MPVWIFVSYINAKVLRVVFPYFIFMQISTVMVDHAHILYARFIFHAFVYQPLPKALYIFTIYNVG